MSETHIERCSFFNMTLTLHIYSCNFYCINCGKSVQCFYFLMKYKPITHPFMPAFCISYLIFKVRLLYYYSSIPDKAKNIYFCCRSLFTEEYFYSCERNGINRSNKYQFPQHILSKCC